uniref:PDZ domain-containing protein n=1 Tax=Tetranychus urticae TaxID=32264 RepID=T1K929_TETUR
MDDLVSLINQWNINRVELFALSLPNENGEFCGVMRFCYQDAGQKVATKCVRVCSNATTLDVIDSLIEKFRADIKMLSVPQYGLYEIHENGEERKLDDDERPLLVQLNWHKDDREGRFLLKRIDEKSTGESGTLTRKLSKSGKKDKKKKEKNEESKESSLAGKLYDELPETCFTRSISNPEAVMKRRRKQKLEKKLQLLQQNGPDAGGTLRIFGECLNPDVPYKTLLLSAKDTARYVVQQILEKYREIGNFQEAEPASSYCLVLVIEPPQDRLIQYVLDDNDCPLAIKQKHNPARGQLTFHIRKRSVDCQPQITPGSPQVPSQIPSQLPPQVPTQQLPPQVPPQFPPQLPPQIPLQLQSQLPLQIPVQLPTQVSSQLPSQSSQSSQSSPQLALQSHSMRKMTQSHSMLPPPYHHTIDLGHRIYDNLHGVASSSMSHFPSPSPSPVPFTIQLRKSGSGLGFSIVAARSLRTGQIGIYVKSIIKGGTADLDGRLQPGDQLLSVNNHSLIDMPQEKAAKLMTQSSIVRLEVAKQAAYYNGLATFLNEVQRATPQLPSQLPAQLPPQLPPQYPAHLPPQLAHQQLHLQQQLLQQQQPHMHPHQMQPQHIEALEMEDENDPAKNFQSYGPNVIGAHEIYKDPRERIEAEKMKTQPQKKIIAGPEKLTFKEKLQLFAEE